jgi:hypothetical protein
MAFVYMVTKEVWECGACRWNWFSRKQGVVPNQCPNRGCRQRLTIGGGDGISRKEDLSAVFGVDLGAPSTDGARGSLGNSQSESGAVGGGVQTDSGLKREVKGKKLTVEQFLELKPSDKMRAQREGKAP